MEITSAHDLNAELTQIQRESLLKLASRETAEQEIQDHAAEFHRACAAVLASHIVARWAQDESDRHTMPIATILVERFDGPPGAIVQMFHRLYRQFREGQTQALENEAAKLIRRTLDILLYEMNIPASAFCEDEEVRAEFLNVVPPQPHDEQESPEGETTPVEREEHEEWIEARREWIERLQEFTKSEEHRRVIQEVIEGTSINTVLEETERLLRWLIQEQGLEQEGPASIPFRQIRDDGENDGDDALEPAA